MPTKPTPVQPLLVILASAGSAGCVLLAGSGLQPPGLMALLSAVGTGAVGALLLAGARKRSRVARREAFRDARAMLQDRLSGHLHLLLRAATAPDRALDGVGRARLAEVVHAAREVESALDLLSEATVEAWGHEAGGPDADEAGATGAAARKEP